MCNYCESGRLFYNKYGNKIYIDQNKQLVSLASNKMFKTPVDFTEAFNMSRP